MNEPHIEHGPDCTCGCHHDHDHGRHDHGHHDHGHHDHADARERSVDFSWGVAVLESHMHDQAATVSATIRSRADADETFEVLVRAISGIARRVEEAGGIVGHIKAYARGGASFAHASATDAQREPAFEGDVRMTLDPDVQCQLVAIALLLDLDQLEEITVAALEE